MLGGTQAQGLRMNNAVHAYILATVVPENGL